LLERLDMKPVEQKQNGYTETHPRACWWWSRDAAENYGWWMVGPLEVFVEQSVVHYSVGVGGNSFELLCLIDLAAWRVTLG